MACSVQTVLIRYPVRSLMDACPVWFSPLIDLRVCKTRMPFMNTALWHLHSSDGFRSHATYSIFGAQYVPERLSRFWRSARSLFSADCRRSSSSRAITMKSEEKIAAAPLSLSSRMVSPWHFLAISPDPHGQGRCPRYSSKQTAPSSFTIVVKSVSSKSSP